MSALALRRWALAEAFKRLAHQPLATLLALLLATAALALPLALAALAWTLQPAWKLLGTPAQAIVFVTAGTANSDLATLQRRVTEQAGVAGVTVLPRDAALAGLNRRSPTGALPEMRSNPLPDALVVDLAGKLAPSQVETTLIALRKLPKVDDVHFDSSWYRQWHALRQVATAVGGAAGGALALVLVGLLWLLPRLLAPAHPLEARVLLLVGADRASVRRPAAYAGMLLGAFAALLAIGLLVAGDRALAPWLAELPGLVRSDRVAPTHSGALAAAVVVLAALLGGAAGDSAGRRATQDLVL